MMGESKMTTNEYLAALKRLGLTQTSKATQEGLGVTSRQLTRYSNGVTSVPPICSSGCSPLLSNLWPHLDKLCSSRHRAEIFRSLCETDNSKLSSVYQTIDLLYGATKKFYYRNRKADGEPLDVPAFFKRKDQYEKFYRHWQRSGLQRKFNKRWSKFSSVVKVLEAA